MLKFLTVLLAFYTFPASAKDLPLVLNELDQQTLVQGLDALMKTQGLVSLTNGTAVAVQQLYHKLQQAAQTQISDITSGGTVNQ